MSDHDESQHDSPESFFFDNPGMAVVYAAILFFAAFFTAWCFGWVQL